MDDSSANIALIPVLYCVLMANKNDRQEDIIVPNNNNIKYLTRVACNN